MREKLTVLRADPAGNVTLLVLDAVPPSRRAATALALLARWGGEQVGFLTEPRQGGQLRLEMMGGEFCGNAARCAGLWAARRQGNRGVASVTVEVSGCAAPLSVLADTDKNTAEAQMPLPLALESFDGLPVALLPGIAHALFADGEPEEATARAVTGALCRRYDVPAAGLLYLRRDGLFLRPAVYVRDTDTLFFESSCASGSAAAAALLCREEGDGTYRYDLKQPGGVIRATALRQAGALRRLCIGGALTLGEPFVAELP